MTSPFDPAFPCSLTIDLPLPTARLASIALRAISVDPELSPLVQRSFSTISPAKSTSTSSNPNPSSSANTDTGTDGVLIVGEASEESILRTEYKATTNRMLRVAVNGFMESLSVVLGIMRDLDVDILGVEEEGKE
ncbi:hypothetical protein VTL71DRAFT_4025 [Oculimacula yallundae]|uniref:Uncharacterized protein n=1 Tax=Oculimacula yallundae TaxID=86028 RepID=A0ABR4C5D8_9HELO